MRVLQREIRLPHRRALLERPIRCLVLRLLVERVRGLLSRDRFPIGTVSNRTSRISKTLRRVRRRAGVPRKGRRLIRHRRRRLHLRINDLHPGRTGELIQEPVTGVEPQIFRVLIDTRRSRTRPDHPTRAARQDKQIRRRSISLTLSRRGRRLRRRRRLSRRHDSTLRRSHPTFEHRRITHGLRNPRIKRTKLGLRRRDRRLRRRNRRSMLGERLVVGGLRVFELLLGRRHRFSDLGELLQRRDHRDVGFAFHGRVRRLHHIRRPDPAHARQREVTSLAQDLHQARLQVALLHACPLRSDRPRSGRRSCR